MRLIDADALIEDLRDSLFYSDSIPFVEEAPTVENVLTLPCEIGSTIYDITEFIEGYDSPDIYKLDTSRIEISKDEAGLIYCIDSADFREKDFGTVLFRTEEAALKAIAEKGWIL